MSPLSHPARNASRSLDRQSANPSPPRPARSWLCWILLCSLAVQGCGGGAGGPTPVKVRGLIKYNGQPVTSGSVMFNPADPQKGHMAQGSIEKDGTFSLSSYSTGDGVLPGSYTVTVNSSLPGTEVLTKDKGTGIGGKSAIPARYADAKTSQLQQTIAAGDSGKTITLELKD